MSRERKTATGKANSANRNSKYDGRLTNAWL